MDSAASSPQNNGQAAPAVAAAAASQTSTTSSTTTNPLHWQAAFWGIAMVGLNNAAQTCGDTCGISKDFNMAVRSSPIICFADALHTVLIICVAMLSKRLKLSSALTAVARRRHQVSTGQNRDLSADAFWMYQFMKILIFVLFIYSIIKIMPVDGIPWTRAFCMMFVVSYSIDCILNHYAGIPISDRDVHLFAGCLKTSDILLNFMGNLAQVAQLVLWVSIVRQFYPTYVPPIVPNGTHEPTEDPKAMAPSSRSPIVPVNRVAASVSLGMLGILYLVALLIILLRLLPKLLRDEIFTGASPAFYPRAAFSPNQDALWNWLSIATVGALNLLLIGCVTSCCIYLLQPRQIVRDFEHDSSPTAPPYNYSQSPFFSSMLKFENELYRYVKACTCIFFLCSGVYVSFKVILPWRWKRVLFERMRYEPDAEVILASMLFLLNVFTAFAFYAKFYDETTTNAPAWMNNLP